MKSDTQDNKKLANLKPHPDSCIDDPESYVHFNWGDYWNQENIPI